MSWSAGNLAVAQDDFDDVMYDRNQKALTKYLKENENKLTAEDLNKLKGDDGQFDPSRLSEKDKDEMFKRLGQQNGPEGNKMWGTSFGDGILGSVNSFLSGVGNDFTNMFTAGSGNITSSAGMVDENGVFHPRTCFVAGTKIRVLKKSLASKVKRPEDIPVTKEFEELANIEDVRVGDYVLSWNEKSKKTGYANVLNTFVRKTDLIYTLKAGKDSLETTWNHPFWVVGSEAERTANGEQRIGAKSADSSSVRSAFSEKLSASYTDKISHSGYSASLVSAMQVSEPSERKGSWVQAKDLRAGDTVMKSDGTLLKIESIKSDKRTETVYNFEVAGNHTYFVGEEGVLVHNADYGGAQGINRWKTDIHQVDFDNVNEEEDRLRKEGKLTDKKKKELSQKLESYLKVRQEDYINDQLNDYIKDKKCKSRLVCGGISEFEQGLRYESQRFVNMKLEQFKSPVVGYDFLTDKPVKMPQGQKILDVTDNVKARISIAESEYQNLSAPKNRYFVGMLLNNHFQPGGLLDFKTDSKIVGPDAEFEGYQGFIKYDGKFLMQPDLGNIVYGHFVGKYGGMKLGLPTDKPEFELWPNTTIMSSGHYRQLKVWKELDRARDQRGMAHGYRCGTRVILNCSTSSDTGWPKDSK